MSSNNLAQLKEEITYLRQHNLLISLDDEYKYSLGYELGYDKGYTDGYNKCLTETIEPLKEH